MKKVIFAALFFTSIAFYYFHQNDKPALEEAELTDKIGTEKEVDSNLYAISTPFNLPIHFSFEEESNQIKKNQSLSDILAPYNVGHRQIYELAEKAKGIFDVRKIRSGKTYHTILECDSSGQDVCRYFVYDESPTRSIIIGFGDSITIETFDKPVTKKIQVKTGTIENSLYLTLAEIDAPTVLANALSEVYAWSVDFYRIQKGDQFRVLYEETYVEDQRIGVDQIIAAEFIHMNDTLPAYHFDNVEGADYFDREGNSLRKAFLKAPVKYSRISSRYNPTRYHPVLKKIRPHLGTDYAAPTGTPVYAVGDGTITHAQYSKYNGNYVKIKHNGTYTTQYLHLSGFGKGIRSGTRVKQGQVIGYVGATGLATGPHVCFRFWKNGQQVDPLKEKIPPSKPVPEELMAAFQAHADSLDVLLKGTQEMLP